MKLLSKTAVKNTKFGKLETRLTWKTSTFNFYKSYVQQVQTLDTYNSILQSGLESSSLGRVEGTLREMKEKDIKPNPVTRQLLINLANQQNDVPLAVEQFEELFKAKQNLTDISYAQLLSNLARNKGAKHVSKVFSSIKNPNYKHYEYAIKALSEAGDNEAAASLYQKMKKDGIPVNAPTYASLMKLSSAKKDLQTTLSYWQELKQKGIYPNLHHFDSLLFVYHSLNDQQGINNTLQELQANDISPQGISESDSFTVSLVRKFIAEQKGKPSTPPSSKPTKEQSDSEKKEKKTKKKTK